MSTHRPLWFPKIALIVMLLAGMCRAAENALFVTVSNDVSAQQPAATITLWAEFDASYLAFKDVILICTATADPGEFSDPVVLTRFGLSGYVWPDGDTVDGVVASQLQDPLGGFYADTSNPIPLWQATWSTQEFEPRAVVVSLDVEEFRVYLNQHGDSMDILADTEIKPGVIHIVPAIPTLAPLLIAAAGTMGRSRI